VAHEPDAAVPQNDEVQRNIPAESILAYVRKRGVKSIY
jgi:hypothetical protein